MTWLAGFESEMIIYDEGEATIVAAVCAKRVFRVRMQLLLGPVRPRRNADLFGGDCRGGIR